MSTPEQVALKFAATGKLMTEADVRGANAIAAAIESAVLPLAAAASGGDLRLSGVGKGSPRRGSRTGAGAKIGVRRRKAIIGGGLQSFGRFGASNTTAIVYATGPFHFIERDTARHGVGTRGYGVSLMEMPDGDWATGPFFAGGSSGKHPFERGVDVVSPSADRLAHAPIYTGLAGIWGL